MRPCRRVLATICLTIAGATNLPSQAVSDAPLTKGMLAFDGRGTLGAFSGTTMVVQGQVTGAAEMSGVRGWVEAPAKSLVTGNGKRDHDMYQSLEVDKYPSLRFELERIETRTVAGDSVAVTLHGRFTIHGQTRAAAVTGWAWLRDGSTRFRGSLPMDARDYGIGGLSKMFGLLKMDPNLVVRIEVVFGS